MRWLSHMIAPRRDFRVPLASLSPVLHIVGVVEQSLHADWADYPAWQRVHLIGYFNVHQRA